MTHSVAHIITGVGVGGAEMMLYKLCKTKSAARYTPHVIVLTEPGPIGVMLEDVGISVTYLGMRRGIPNPGAIVTLAKQLRHIQPEIVQSWMYHADLIAAVAKWAVPKARIIWGIRQSNFDRRQVKAMTVWTAKACAALSRWVPDRIVSCSHTARRVHVKMGYSESRLVVIPNGFDLEAFRPNPELRQRMRAEFGIPTCAQVVGIAGRLDPQKDYGTFLQAAGMVARARPHAWFLMCGQGVDSENTQLMNQVADAGIKARCTLTGRREEMAEVFASMDMAVSSSAYGEGFPNVLGEAMACGIPCVVTDVGDSEIIVGDTGLVVPPKRPDLLATAIEARLELPKAELIELGTKARQRIRSYFSLSKVVRQYEGLYDELVRGQ